MTTQTVPEYVKAVRAATVQMADSTHRTVKENEPVRVSELSEFFRDALADEGSWTARLFTASTEAEHSAWIAGNRPPEIKDFDRRLAEMSHVVLPGPDEQASIREGEAIIHDGDAMADAKGQRTSTDTQLSPAAMAAANAEASQDAADDAVPEGEDSARKGADPE